MEDKDLEGFLRTRGFDETILQYFLQEKISTDTINLMDDDQLKKFIPKYGDRIALKDFCRRKLPSKKRSGLLNKLKKKLRGKSKLNEETIHSSDSEEDEMDSSGKKQPMFRKTTRLIDLGWMHSEDGVEYHQVRARNGGGTRSINVPINAKKKDLIIAAINLFFPKGVSPKGKLEEYAVDLRDYGQNIMKDDTITVSDILRLTGFPKLRFYLSTHKVQRIQGYAATYNDTKDYLSGQQSDPGPSSRLDHNTFHSQVNEPPGSSVEAFGEVFYGHDIDDQNPEIDLLHFNNTESNNTNSNVADVVISSVISPFTTEFLDLSQVIPDSASLDNENIKLTLHRGRILEELVNAFSILDKNCPSIVIEIIMPNGKAEVGVDVGGVFRDAISEFWTTFYDTCTIGAKSKIPYVRHDYGTEQWKAVAKILYKGYKEEKYFPLKLSVPFMECCFTGTTKTSLYDSFLKFVSESDANIITQAIQNFDLVEETEIQDLFENLESKWIPTASNIEKLVLDIAHKELIQKPKFIIDCWYDELKELSIDLENIYKTTEPTSRNIIACLTPESEEMTGDAVKIFGYLKRFVREAEEDIRSNFLRFCTGADVLVGKKITVSFTKIDGFKRSPIAHTCNCLLELPLSYDSFPEFRSEFNILLKSNVWIMDLV